MMWFSCSCNKKKCIIPELSLVITRSRKLSVTAGTSNKSHGRYVREAGHLLLAGYNKQEGPFKRARVVAKDIAFTQGDSTHVHWPHNDALVV